MTLQHSYAKGASLIATFLLFAISVTAQEPKVFTKKTENSLSFYVKNPFVCDVSFSFDVKSTNLTAAPAGVIVTPPAKEHFLFKLKSVDPKKRWTFTYKYKFRLGNIKAKHDPQAIYNLPF